ncbi:myb-like protein D isoform X1 [Chironomus tepperi]|uniref:myb-like protein D isoform X1 n=1 Tax=Chironomus tepperi TaxID=113505 RepID=UPI00391F5A8B
MQEDYSDYSDFEIIALDPNVNYMTSDDDDDESEMEYEDTVVWNNDNNKTFTGDKTNDFETELSDQRVEDETMCIENNQEEELLAVVKDVTNVTIEEEPMQLVENVCANEKPRKKLNLAEYKIRRANNPQSPVEKFDKNVVLELCEIIPDTLPILELPTDPRSIKNLLEGNSSKDQDEQNVDEISEINSNVQSTQTIDPTIHPDYEEIVLVSMECQTEISISPHEIDEDCEKKSSSGFLTNIVNSFQHNNNAKTILNSTSTLLSSINEVLNEKRSNSSNEMKTKSDSNDHGENKVIMHLRKDRIRPYRNCAAIQTEISPLFPPLILSPSLIFNRIKNSRNFRRRSTSRSRSRSRSRSLSPEPEYYNSSRRSNYKYSRSVNSSSMNSSEMDSSSESDTSAYSSCRSSDHDSLKRFDNRFKHGYQRPNNYNFQEERKIIYVGGLFEETTKDELRRKFLKYGTIKKISLHTKEDGSLKYGFVTFAEASAAFDVLDRFSNDPAISSFDLRFGGRRKFCRQTYADLDSQNQENEVEIFNNNTTNNSSKSKTNELSFEDLLNMTKRKLCKNN